MRFKTFHEYRHLETSIRVKSLFEKNIQIEIGVLRASLNGIAINECVL